MFAFSPRQDCKVDEPPDERHLDGSDHLRDYFTLHHLNQHYYSHSHRDSFSFETLATPKMKSKSELKKAFQSSKSAQEMLKVFKEMERTGYKEEDLGKECGELAARFSEEGKEPEQVLYFGNRSLKFYLALYNNGEQHARVDLSLRIAYISRAMGSASSTLTRYDDSLRYLTLSQRHLLELEQAKSCPDHILFPSLLHTEGLLFDVKCAMGRREQAPPHMVKILELRRKVLDESSIELGQLYKMTYMSYLGAMDIKGAYPFCEKALEIYSKHFGCDSVEVGEIRRHFSGLCYAAGEHDKSAELLRLSESTLKKSDNSFQRNAVQVEKGNMLVHHGRYEEAIQAFSALVLCDDVEPGPRGTAFLSMAGAYQKLGRFADAKKWIRVGLDIFEKMDINSPDRQKRDENILLVAIAFMEVSRLYEVMDDFESALLFARKMLAVPELPRELLSQGAKRLFSLIFKTGNVTLRGISYIKAVVEKLKERFGSEHSEVGNAYIKLGAAYMQLGNPQTAAKYMGYAKSILDVSLGPHHLDSLTASQALSTTYAYGGLNRLPLAIEIQEQVVEGFKGLGSSEQDKLLKAVTLLNQMKADKARDEVAEPPKKVSDQSKDGEAFLSKNSLCATSEDEMVAKLEDVKLNGKAGGEVAEPSKKVSDQSEDCEMVAKLEDVKLKDKAGGEVAEPSKKVSDQSEDCEMVAELEDIKLKEETSREVTKYFARSSTQPNDDEEYSASVSH